MVLLRYPVLLDFVCVLVGCSTTISRVPNGQPRGYVEFRPEGHFGGRIRISEISTNGWSDMPVGVAGFVTHKAKLRTVVLPGKHRFAVDLGTAHRAIDINVVEGLVVPVVIRILNHQQTAEYHYGMPAIIHHQFRMELVPAPPEPPK